MIGLVRFRRLPGMFTVPGIILAAFYNRPMSLSTQRSLSDERREHPWSFWAIVVVLVILNGWWDYYHPLGILFDVIIVIIWAVRSDIKVRDV